MTIIIDNSLSTRILIAQGIYVIVWLLTFLVAWIVQGASYTCRCGRDYGIDPPEDWRMFVAIGLFPVMGFAFWIQWVRLCIHRRTCLINALQRV